MKTPEPESVRVGPVSAVPELLHKHASEPVEQILAEVGLDLALFDNPDNSISFVKVGQLFNLCAIRTGIPHFGHMVGLQAAPASLGQLAELAVHAPNVGSALYSMILHVCINDRGGVPTLTTEDDIAKLGYAIYIPMHKGARQVYSASLTIICNLLRSMCGGTWNPSEVRFSATRPKDIKPYQSYFKSTLTFESGEDALVFPKHWLHHPLPNADIELHNLAVERLTTVEMSMHIDFEEEMRSLLRPLIATQHSSAEHVARMLALHPRTLNRRLKDKGTTLRKMVGEIRYEMAKQLLDESDIPLLNISNTLGYSDASVFTHAFQRWSGMSPSAWRKNQMDSIVT